MKQFTFTSQLAPIIWKYLESRQNEGYTSVHCGYYMQELDCLSKELSDAPVVTKELIDAWDLLKPYLSNRSKIVRHNAIRAFAKFAYTQDGISYVPDTSKLKNSSTFTPHIFTVEEIRRLLYAADNLPVRNNAPTRHLVIPAVIRLLYCCGFRIGEVLRLRVKDVDLDTGIITVHNGKGGKDRLVPVHNSVIEYLRSYSAQLPDEREWFFPSACGHYSIKTIYDNFRELLFACNIPHTGNGPRVHDFRHTFAVHTLEKQLSDGYDPMVIVPRLAAYLGHKSYRETCWYIHLTVVRGVGYDPKAFQIDCWLHAQSPDIAGAVNVPLDDTDPDALGAGDQGIVVGYACKETPQFMPLPVVLAHRLTSLLTLARMTDTIHGIGPDGKAQVTVEYAVNEPDHEDAPLRVSTVVLSVQHAANKNPDELAQELTEQVIAPALRGQPVDDALEILINPSGSFVLGGPEADTGLTGRKLAVDAYGPFAPQGGGALSGKDPTKVDRSGAYMARYIAKNLVAAGMAERCQVTLAYAIGMAEPVMVEVDTFGTCLLCADDCLAKAVRQVFDLTPAGMIETLDLQNPFYARTAVGGHFGREDFPWERVDKVGLLLNAIL